MTGPCNGTEVIIQERSEPSAEGRWRAERQDGAEASRARHLRSR